MPKSRSKRAENGQNQCVVMTFTKSKRKREKESSSGSSSHSRSRCCGLCIQVNSCVCVGDDLLS